MTVIIEGDSPSFVVADSTLKLKIKGLKKFIDDGKIVSEKIQLPELSDVSCQVFSFKLEK